MGSKGRKNVKKPKQSRFESPFWHIIGILIGLTLVADGIWSIIVQFNEPFFPFQAGRILRTIIGLALTGYFVNKYRRRI
jgi:polyferredoxin